MAKYDDDMMIEGIQRLPKEVPEKFRIPKRLRGNESDRIPNLPSDTALESNKERQDAEMISALTKFGRAMLPGQLGPTIADEIKNRRKPELLRRFKKGGKVSSASKRADGIAQRGKTKGRFV